MRPSTTRVAVLADIGQRAYHVGDEAIGIATVRELESRGANTVLIARDATAVDPALRGRDIVRSVDVPWDPAQRGRLLRDVSEGRRTLRGRRALGRPDVGAVVEALRSVDALHIAGGGNHTSLYGWLLTERSITVTLAHHLGVAATLSGQTLGPSLHAADREALTDELRALASVAVRDRASAELARTLLGDEAAVRVSVDDATFLADPAGAEHTVSEADHISATFSSDFIDRIGERGEIMLARALVHLSESLDLPVRFEAHMQVPDEHSGDAVVHRRLADRMPAERALVHSIRNADEVARAMATAAVVVTSRFHPVVFACAAGVPALALGGSHYANVRLDGVLDTWGLDGFRATPTMVLDGTLEQRVDQLLAAGPAITQHLRDLSADRRGHWSAGWDAVLAPGKTAPAPLEGPRFEAPWGMPSPAQALTDRLECEREKLVVELDLAESLVRAKRRPFDGVRNVVRL